MGTSYTARKCTQCAGKLEYVPEKKVWRCIYCGAEIERQEEYSGPFTVRSVAQQALAAMAFRRFDIAFQNLAECDKIDGGYAGSLVAKVAFSMLAMINKGGDKGAVANYMEQLRKCYDRLKKLAESDDESEIAFYEFLDESDSFADIFATLAVVYDSLNDEVRRDLMLKHLKIEGIISKEANTNLLFFVLRTKDYGKLEAILSNTKALDSGKALVEVLKRMEDGEEKRSALLRICKTRTLPPELKESLERYVAETSDGSETIMALACALQEAGIVLDLGIILRRCGCDATVEQVRQLVKAYCRRKLRDEEIAVLVDFAFGSACAEMPGMVLETLSGNGQYVYLCTEQLVILVANRQLKAREKAEVLQTALSCNIEPRGTERLFAMYLCDLQQPPEERALLLPILHKAAGQVSPVTIKKYVLLDGVPPEEKTKMVESLLEGELNTSLFNALPSEYIASSKDSPAVRDSIFQLLARKGMKFSADDVMAHLTHQDVTDEDMLPMIERMLDNGVQLPNDAASRYLEQVAPGRFNQELFDHIHTASSNYSGTALVNFVLKIPEASGRQRLTEEMLTHCVADPSSLRCPIVHLGNRLVCSLLQAYVLTCPDSSGCAMDMARLLAEAGNMKLSSPLSVNDSEVKFKTYASENKGKLNANTLAICDDFNVFSFFFHK